MVGHYVPAAVSSPLSTISNLVLPATQQGRSPCPHILHKETQTRSGKVMQSGCESNEILKSAFQKSRLGQEKSLLVPSTACCWPTCPPHLCYEPALFTIISLCLPVSVLHTQAPAFPLCHQQEHGTDLRLGGGNLVLLGSGEQLRDWPACHPFWVVCWPLKLESECGHL